MTQDLRVGLDELVLLAILVTKVREESRGSQDQLGRMGQWEEMGQ